MICYMKEDLISIVVPVYNCEEFLDRCIDSIVNQSYKNIEIILVNDGSKDNSLKICNNWANKDERIKVINQRNKGAAAARNTGINESTGKFVGFVDSDDFIENNMYECLYKNIKLYSCDISICGRIIEEGSRIIYKSKNNIKKKYTNIDALVEMNSLKTFDMSPCDKLYNRELFNLVLFPEGTNSEDFYFMYKMLFNCSIVYYDSSPLYHYCRRENSHSNYKINDTYIKASKEQVDFFSENCKKIVYVAKCYYAYANTIQYNKYVVHNMECPKDVLKDLKRNVFQNMISVLKNLNFPLLNKAEIFLFVLCTPIYKKIIKLKHKKRN